MYVCVCMCMYVYVCVCMCECVVWARVRMCVCVCWGGWGCGGGNCVCWGGWTRATGAHWRDKPAHTHTQTPHHTSTSANAHTCYKCVEVSTHIHTCNSLSDAAPAPRFVRSYLEHLRICIISGAVHIPDAELVYDRDFLVFLTTDTTLRRLVELSETINTFVGHDESGGADE